MILSSPTVTYLSVTPRPEPISQSEKRKRNATAIHAVAIEAAVPLIVTKNQTVAMRQMTPRIILSIFPGLCSLF